jgi:hypothetical protein
VTRYGWLLVLVLLAGCARHDNKLVDPAAFSFWVTF